MPLHVDSKPHFSRCGRAAFVSLFALAACGTEAPEEVGSFSEALTGGDAGTVTISGTVADAMYAQAGITITLSGSAQAQTVTNYTGAYSFTVKSGGSYSLTAAGTPNFYQPPFQSCLTLTPSIVNLNNLTTDAVQNFVGSGTSAFFNCAPAEVMGATSGPLTIGGTVTSRGQPVPGMRVALNGSAQGTRVTDESGAYSFSVRPGSYSLGISGVCSSFAPSVVNLNNVKTNETQYFTATNCPPAPLELCPTLDSLFGISEPASCNTVSSIPCLYDRTIAYLGILFDWQTLNASDCRFGLWQVPPISNMFTEVGLQEQTFSFQIDEMQLHGCALAGNLVGPLPFFLIPPDLAKLSFTTADLAALIDELTTSINQALADNGSPPLSPAQTTAIQGQMASAASRVPGVKSSSTLTYSTCGADAGTP
jgi:hypothetical protein